jgi:two-component system chemotaxis response regulator CheB
VLLSGALDDGSVGMMAVKEHGGTAIVQDPGEALYVGIPEGAIQRDAVDHILMVEEIAQLLTRLTREAVALQEGSLAMLPEDQEYLDPAQAGTAAIDKSSLLGHPTGLTCPDCGGAIWESVNGDLVRYRCHVGHAYTADSMVGAQASAVETALWSAVRALEEKAELSRRLAERSRRRGINRLAGKYQAAVENAERGSDAIRQLLLSGTAEPPSSGGSDTDEPEEAAGWPAEATGMERM